MAPLGTMQYPPSPFPSLTSLFPRLPGGDGVILAEALFSLRPRFSFSVPFVFLIAAAQRAARRVAPWPFDCSPSAGIGTLDLVFSLLAF